MAFKVSFASNKECKMAKCTSQWVIQAISLHVLDYTIWLVTVETLFLKSSVLSQILLFE